MGYKICAFDEGVQKFREPCKQVSYRIPGIEGGSADAQKWRPVRGCFFVDSFWDGSPPTFDLPADWAGGPEHEFVEKHVRQKKTAQHAVISNAFTEPCFPIGLEFRQGGLATQWSGTAEKVGGKPESKDQEQADAPIQKKYR